MAVMTRIGICFLLAMLVVPAQLSALEIGLGLSAIEEGDDRYRPGVLLHVSPRSGFYGRMFYYGRKYGPLIERNFLMSVNAEIDAFRMMRANFLKGSLGLVFMNQQTELQFDGADSDESEVENSPNGGFVFGLHATAPFKGPVFLKMSVESHMFLAGEAGILLANGRKHMVSLISGVKF